MNARQGILGIALLATLAATFWVATQKTEDEGEAAMPARADRTTARAAREAGAAAKPAALATTGAGDRYAALTVEREPWPDVADELARRANFNPPPPAAPAVRTAPAAPPLPFRFIGGIDDGQGKAVFLLDGNQVRLVREGGMVAGQYRLDRITPVGIEFTYLPLDVKQTLSRQSQ